MSFPRAPDDVYPPCRHGSFRINHRRYNEEEKAIMNQFKKDYLKATSPTIRRDIICGGILIALFKRWDKEVPGGHAFIDEKHVSKTLMDYIRNNWRTKPVKTLSKLSIKLSQVLWIHHRNKVYREIYRLQNKDPVDDVCPDNYFPFKSKAIGNILKAISPEELQQLKAEKRTMADHGLPHDVRAERCKKYSAGRIAETDRRNWLEMGMLSITFTAGRHDGFQFGYYLHDNINTVLGVRCRKFEDEQRVICDQMLRLFKAYVTKINTLAGLSHNIAPAPAEFGITKKDQSFPMIVNAPADLTRVKRETLELIYRGYFNMHYELASCHQFTATPWTDVEASQHDYIDPKYLPQHFKMTRPNDMSKQHLRTMISYIVDRQSVHPLPEVFRFKRVNLTKRAGQHGHKPAMYPDDPAYNDDTIANARKNIRAKKTKGKKGAAKVQGPVLQQLLTSSTADPPSIQDQGIASAQHNDIGAYTFSFQLPIPSNETQSGLNSDVDKAGPSAPTGVNDCSGDIGSTAPRHVPPKWAYQEDVHAAPDATTNVINDTDIDPMLLINGRTVIHSIDHLPAHNAVQSGDIGPIIPQTCPDWDIASQPLLNTWAQDREEFNQDQHLHLAPLGGPPPLGSPPGPPIVWASLPAPDQSMQTYIGRPSLSALHDFTKMLPTPRNTATPVPMPGPSQHRITDDAPQGQSCLKKKKIKKSAVDRLNEEAEAYQAVATRTRKGKKQ